MTKNTPILIVGNASHDTIINQNDKVINCLGGSVSYISNILTALSITHDVISHVGHDFKYLHKCTFFPTFFKNSETTAFVNINSPPPRVQKVVRCCNSISSEDISYTANIAIVCSIINEVSPMTIKKIRANSRILIADIQGFIRKRHKDNSIRLSHINDTMYSKSVFLFDFIKVSEEEIEYINFNLLIKSGVKIIVTRANKGCYFYSKYSSSYIPVLPITPVDDTGAGDSFLAGFVAGLYNHLSIDDSIGLGHKCANVSIKFVGVPARKEFINLKI